MWLPAKPTCRLDCCCCCWKVIEPIQSRCAIVRFTKVSDADILARLQVVSAALVAGAAQHRVAYKLMFVMVHACRLRTTECCVQSQVTNACQSATMLVVSGVTCCR
jgi:hypothetical protein